jgi:hypothetical protein
VDIFINGKVYNVLEGKDYQADLMSANLHIKKGMCDFDADQELHTNHVCDHGCFDKHAHKL